MFYPGLDLTDAVTELPIEGFDAQIAAICRARGAALATRNVKDFRETGIDVIDPWQPG
jgi:predicted nucleic acid-binding protein